MNYASPIKGTIDLLEVPVPKFKRRPWNVRLIPNHLKELAQSGVYYDSKVL